MQISFSASGTPAQINAAINQQSKAARGSNPAHAAPTIGSVRDYIAAEVAGLGPEDKATVSASVSVRVVKAAPVPAPAPAPAVEVEKVEKAPAEKAEPKK